MFAFTSCWLQTLPAQLASIEAREKALQDSDNKLKALQAEIKELTKQRANLEKEVDRYGDRISLCICVGAWGC
jgi:peptidoglycan hydrolase CwlO-like protein